MVAQIVAITATAITTAVGEKICNVMGRPDIGEYVKISGIGLSGGLAVSIISNLLKQVAETFGGY